MPTTSEVVDLDLDAVQRGICGNRRRGEVVDLGGERRRAAPAFAAAIATIPDPAPKSRTNSAAHAFGMIQEIARQSLPASPGEGPKRRRHCAPLQDLLGRLPDWRDLGRQMQADLRH